MSRDNPYRPIDCNIYDELEILSMRRIPVTLLPNRYDVPPPLYITDLRAEDGVEYMYINEDLQIRLDALGAIEGPILFLDGGDEEE